ncbi:DUF4097 domain-containing protein [Gemmatimonas sp.]|uniref:DUF4097 family beta strand repeat-containing protein n=2 Tax=Gemmatimonas sp. TaxID=1962908 RepID=UPI003567A4A9
MIAHVRASLLHMEFPMLSFRSSTRSALRSAAAALLLTATIAAPAVAQDRERDRDMQRDNAFTWSGTIPSGRRILIKNINGAIQVEHSTNGRVEVSAEKRWRRGNPEDVRIEQKKIGDDVLVCALFSEGSRCDESGIHSDRRTTWNDRNDVSVRFTVRVPDGVRVDLSTVNGGVEVTGVNNEVDAHTVNGSITARSAGGPVRAKTVNGSITVSMGALGRADDLDYETVNGAITIELPSNFGAQLELATVNGRVSTDFPITISGTLSPRRLRGTVGNGATRIRASTVNGSVTLRKIN